MTPFKQIFSRFQMQICMAKKRDEVIMIVLALISTVKE